ncbi:hypothetical protein K440DRAFT_635643 [Wilcoxina mikolae CBS 423.85]|nr:hypothetical protein K440DRAFT_635643 [Wilcoxina mikolae CBS 423.85]
MHFLRLLTPLYFLLLTLASAKKPDQTHCKRGQQLCEIAMSWDDCSALYIASMKACILTGCIKWKVDPLKHCEKKAVSRRGMRWSKNGGR